MKNKPHIFLDSNIFYTDPFQNNRFNSAMINLSNMSEINLYITDVVYKETINNFKKLLSEKLSTFNKAFKSLNNLTSISSNLASKSTNEYIKSFESHFEDLTTSLIKVIPFYPDDINEVVSRSINEIKPFSKNKQEFRDCMIWLTIKRFILENELSDCYFITANTRDFYDEFGKNLHPTLKNDIPNLIPLKSSKELILNVGNLNKIIIEEELDIWSYLNVTDDVIEKIVSEDISEEFENKLELEIKQKYEGEFIGNNKINKVQIGSIEDIEIISKTYKVVQDFSFFSCNFELQLPTLFSNYEKLIEDYISDEFIVKVSGKLHFTIRPNEKAQFNNLDHLELKI